MNEYKEIIFIKIIVTYNISYYKLMQTKCVNKTKTDKTDIKSSSQFRSQSLIYLQSDFTLFYTV